MNSDHIKIKEPFKGLFTQGMVCHKTFKDENNNWLSPDEVYTENSKDYFLKSHPTKKAIVGPSESMSKSKKNTINPQKIIKKYGADAVRFFILSDSPPDRDIQWSEDGIISSYKFIQKFWLLNNELQNLLIEKNEIENNDLEIFTNKMIAEINQSLETFRYNLMISIYHKIYSYYKKIVDKKTNFKNLKKNYEKVLIIMMPVMPHLVSECLEMIQNENGVTWPTLNKEMLIENICNIVIQVNGKKRGIIKLKSNLEKDKVIKEIIDSKVIDRHLNQDRIIKIVYIKDKIVNFIVK
jgi:leucyl-tRNA synthetase